MSDRTRGIIVQELDLAPIKTQLLARLQERDPTFESVHLGGRWATVTDPKGRKHLICDEGVGAIFSDDNPYEVEVYADRRDAEGNRTMSMMPEGIVRFTPSLLADLPTEDIDLADFVRTFGARLEQNFRENYEILTGQKF